METFIQIEESKESNKKLETSILQTRSQSAGLYFFSTFGLEICCMPDQSFPKPFDCKYHSLTVFFSLYLFAVLDKVSKNVIETQQIL